MRVGVESELFQQGKNLGISVPIYAWINAIRYPQHLEYVIDISICRNLDRDIESSTKRWKKLVESECTEKEKLPQEWKNKTPIQRLCMMRALRPDRMTHAVK